MSKASLKAERLRGMIERKLLKRQSVALDYADKVQTDDAVGDQPWQERTRRDAFNLKMVEIAAAGVRAKQLADAGPKVFGVVAVVNRIDDHAKWEEMARAIDAGKQVIDVEALGGVPEKVIHGPRGSVRGIPGQLVGGVPEKGETSGEEEGKGQGTEEAGLLAKAGGQ